MKPLLAGFRRIEITPDGPVSLAGYLNERISRGVLDPLYARLALLVSGDDSALFVQIDSCLIGDSDVDDIKGRIESRTGIGRANVIVFASHTHTAPALMGLFGLKKEEEYLQALKDTIVDEAIRLKADIPVSMRTAVFDYPGLAFNRRWFLKDGRLITNPPKGSPELDRPEGTVDREIGIAEFRDNREQLQALFVNVSNHTDTVGGDRISADWPGYFERELGRLLGCPVPVLTFIAPQGNINHFEFDSPKPQIGEREAVRIGSAYARLVAAGMSGSRPVRIDRIDGRIMTLTAGPREVSRDDLDDAEEIMKIKTESSRADLTAEDLARGDIAVRKIFARELLRFQREKPDSYRVPLQLLRVGPIAFAAIPGEPFAEIGLELKRLPGNGKTTVWPTALANGYFGYIPLCESFDRGGYETMASLLNCLSRDAARQVIGAFASML